MRIKRNVLLNPGSATTDTVKMAQIVPDICTFHLCALGAITKDIEDFFVVLYEALKVRRLLTTTGFPA